MAQNYTLPSWARASGRPVDLRTSPYWSPQQRGGGMETVGNADGSGYYQPLNQFAAQYGGSVVNPSMTAQPNPGGAMDWLGSTGQQLYEANDGSQNARWLQDANGNITAEPQIGSLNDRSFGLAALAAGGLISGNVAGMWGGAPEAAGAAGGGGFSTGAIGGSAPLNAGFSIPSFAGEAAGAAGGGLGAGAVGGGVVSGGAGAAGGAGGSAMGWGDWAQIGASLLGSAVQSNAAKNATNAQTDAANNASNTQLAMFNKTNELQEPWRQAGMGSLNQLTAGTAAGGDLNRDFTMADFNADPGYAFRMREGQRALESSAAARGGLLSGGTGKALVNYGQQAGSQEYGNAYNRFNADRDRRFNRLSSIAGLGQTATRDVSQAGMNTGNNIANNQMAIGNAQSAGSIAQGNAINQGIGTIGNWYQQRPQQQGGQAWWNSGGSNTGSWGSPGMNQFFYGQGTSGD